MGTIMKIRAEARMLEGTDFDIECQTVDIIENELYEEHENLMIVKLPHNSHTSFTDRMFEKYKNLLLFLEDGECRFFGEEEYCKSLKSRYGGRIKGEYSDSKYWIGNADHDEITQYVKSLCKD